MLWGEPRFGEPGGIAAYRPIRYSPGPHREHREQRTENREPNTDPRQEAVINRRDLLKGLAAGAAAAMTGGLSAQSAEPAAAAAGASAATNPYGGGPGSGLTLPPYYRPTPSVLNTSTYFPGSEKLGPDEMRISFVGSCPWPPRRDQMSTSIMVELGNGDLPYFFDFGPGCLRNIMAMGVPVQAVRNFFITHLHGDHYLELAYLLPFRAYMFGGWKPLNVTGPSGKTQELGTREMIANMKKMLRWNLEAFDVVPIGDGYEVNVNEFDYRKENEVCYDKNGVVVKHWPRSHNKDGASAYRLEWNGLSFVWTGDGRPDELTLKYAKGADVFVTEIQADVARWIQSAFHMPPPLYNYTIDVAHTPHYAAGYMFKQIQPRIAMVTHMEYDESLVTEFIAGIHSHWDGMFAFGAPDVVVVNVTKDAIWVRRAALPGLGGMASATPLEMFGEDGQLPAVIDIPKPRTTWQEQCSADIRAIEIDPKKYYPPQVFREPVQTYAGPVGPIPADKMFPKPPEK